MNKITISSIVYVGVNQMGSISYDVSEDKLKLISRRIEKMLLKEHSIICSVEVIE